MNPNDPFNDDNPRDLIDWALSAVALITLIALAYLITHAIIT
jgi:hypothetical protein